MKCGISGVCALALMLSAALPLKAQDSPGNYPEDPFAEERRHLAPTEVGTARGQTQFTALGALVSGPQSDDTFQGGQLSTEFVLHEFMGIRNTVFQDLTGTDFSGLDYRISSLRVGPALHLRPYRRVDIGSYAEGGIALLDLFESGSSARAPEVALGGFISIFVDSFVFVRLELQRTWTRIDTEDVAGSQNRTAGMLGIGVAF